MRKLIAASLAAMLALAACSGDGTSGTESEGASTASGADRTFDVSGVKKVDEIAALVPQAIKDKGSLTIGAAVDYAPAEFLADDLQTAIGYDVDLGKAIGKVLGLETTVTNAEFAGLLPGIGTKYDVGMSAFTITEERTASYNMVAYLEAGSAFATKKGNPNNFDPKNLCGKSIAVQNGTWQDEDLQAKDKECKDAGKEGINALVYGVHTDAATNVVGGKADAFYADSTVAQYASTLSNGQMEVIGDVLDSEPQGIVVAQNDKELTEAVQKAVQHLMDDGTWMEIMKSWGTEEAALSTATVYPEN
ncbi:MAG: ABC transporter substrate-binding protein [Propionibacteriaceae bacterium]|nr:ABC transporter substrate-binding protein [Propionibacteriaceae bacterium]